MTTLFFDLDGTLLDTQSGIADSIRFTLFRRANATVSDEQLRLCFGPPIRESFARLLNTRDATRIAEAVTEFRHHYLSKGIYNYQVYPGILELLQQLTSINNQQQVKIRVLTVKPKLQAEKLLEHSGLSAFFEKIHGTEDCGKNSNKSNHLSAILHHEPELKARCWMIGDRASDIHAAKGNHVTSVAVHWGYADALELSNSDSEHHISNPQELLALLTL